MVKPTSTVIFNARKVDAGGIVEEFWMRMAGTTIVATGIGPPDKDEADSFVNAAGKWLTPGFIDIHCHGGAGFSFGGHEAEIRAALVPHRLRGTTRSVVSLVTEPISSIANSLRVVAAVSRKNPLILGSHIEGPFLSPAHRGAHDLAALVFPDAASVESLLDAAEGTLLQVTIAPELPGADSAIDTFVKNNVRVGIGHTDANYQVARQAFDRGATILTHAFNAMRPIHHREPGPVLAALDDDRVTLELILDGHHLVARVAELVFRAAPERVALVTDAMSAAGVRDGDYWLGSLKVEVKEGRAVLAGTETLAGSTLTQDAALRFALHEVGLSPVEAVAAVTVSPARALGLEKRMGLLRPGFVADAVLLDSEWAVERVWAQGDSLL